MLRYLSPIALTGFLIAGPAGASSIAVLEPSESAATPSVVSYGEPAAETLAPALPNVVVEPPIPLEAPPQELVESANEPIPLSPSVIALGEPAVEAGQVASIGEAAKPRNPHLPPMVIRGGIYGQAFTRSDQGAAGAQAPAPQQTTAAQPGEQPQPQAEPQEPMQPSPPAATKRIE